MRKFGNRKKGKIMTENGVNEHCLADAEMPDCGMLKNKKARKSKCPSWLRRCLTVKFISRIDRYIIVKFLGTYIFSIALIISIAVIFDINERIDKLTQSHAPLKRIVVDYYMNFIPYFSNLFSPLFVFISVIFFTILVYVFSG